MKILAFGDVVGSAGCDHFRKVLPDLKTHYEADIIIVNGENSAEGNGITPLSANHLLDSGANIITTGNHAYRRKQILPVFDSIQGLIRPANYHTTAPGKGYYIYERGSLRLCVINLQGITYLSNIQNPFDCLEQLLPTIDTPNIIIDFHAEATAEKLSLGYYFDGKVSAIVGTHTHVPTADARILPRGTGYITDLGMCGGENSVLGTRAEDSIHKMRTLLPTTFTADPENIRLSGAAITIDDSSGLCSGIEAFTGI